jgi:hypothetical protein
MPSVSISVAKVRIASAHFDNTSAWRSRSVKCRHVKRAPVWTSDRLLVKMWDTAAAISTALGFVAADSCQRRLRRGVMDILDSSMVFDVAMVGRMLKSLTCLRFCGYMVPRGGAVGGRKRSGSWLPRCEAVEIQIELTDLNCKQIAVFRVYMYTESVVLTHLSLHLDFRHDRVPSICVTPRYSQSALAYRIARKSGTRVCPRRSKFNRDPVTTASCSRS